MKLLTFKANNVHDYMNFDIDFLEDLNFLAGLNGTGKTTVLNLIISLITPSIKKIIDIKYDYIELKFEHEGENHSIITTKDDNYFEMKYNENAVAINYKGLRIDDESDIRYELKSDDLIMKLEEIPTPMFLDLKRRFIDNSRNIYEEESIHNDFYRRKTIDDSHGHSSDLSLHEVKKHISKLINSITRKELRRSEALKKNILKESFTIQELSTKEDIEIPTREELEGYKKNILSTLEMLELKDEDDRLFEDFFDSIEKIINDLISIAENRNNKKTKKNDIKIENMVISKWIINQPQLFRIIKLSKLISDHQSNVKKLYEIKNNFLDAVNAFYKQTNKELRIKSDGVPEILINGNNPRKIDYLSSGERQILILLSHLYLNKNLPKNGIFIIDEPELSLHLLWQETFVDAIIKAKPDLQIILATHSPAIIQNKKQNYVPLNKKQD